MVLSWIPLTCVLFYVCITENMFLSAGNLSDEPMLLFPKRTFQPSTIRRKRNHGFFARYISFSFSSLINIQWQFKNLEYETSLTFSLSWVMVFTRMKSLIASSFRVAIFYFWDAYVELTFACSSDILEIGQWPVPGWMPLLVNFSSHFCFLDEHVELRGLV